MNLIGYFTAAALAAAVAILGGYVYNYDARGRKIEVLEAQLGERANQIRVLEQSVAVNKGTIDTLNKRLTERSSDLKASCELLDAVEKSKHPGDDDAVDPNGGILGQVLERLRDPKAKVTTEPPAKKVPPARETVPPGKKQRKG